MRSTWCQWRLRTTTSTSRHCVVSGDCCSSVNCTTPRWITSSGCSSSHSRARLSCVASLDTTSRPATCQRPSCRRRTSSSGASIYSCSSPRRSTERADTVSTTRCSFSAWRCCGSRMDTPDSSMVGNRPSECAVRASMRTGAPRACVAKRSTCTRHSPIRGTMNPCRAPHTPTSTSQNASTSPRVQRATRATRCSFLEGGGGLRSIIRGFTSGWNYRPLAPTRAGHPG